MHNVTIKHTDNNDNRCISDWKKRNERSQSSHDDSSKHSLWIGLTSIPHFVFISIARTRPSEPGILLVTCPSNQQFLGRLSSTTSTTLFAVILSCLCNQLLRSCSVGKYSLVQRVQKISAKCWTWRQRRREYMSCLTNSPGSNDGPCRSWSMWLGVNAVSYTHLTLPTILRV